jgi:hypothetical protein
VRASITFSFCFDVTTQIFPERSTEAGAYKPQMTNKPEGILSYVNVSIDEIKPSTPDRSGSLF